MSTIEKAIGKARTIIYKGKFNVRTVHGCLGESTQRLLEDQGERLMYAGRNISNASKEVLKITAADCAAILKRGAIETSLADNVELSTKKMKDLKKITGKFVAKKANEKLQSMGGFPLFTQKGKISTFGEQILGIVRMRLGLPSYVSAREFIEVLHKALHS